MAILGDMLPWLLASGTLFALLSLLLTSRRSPVENRLLDLARPANQPEQPPRLGDTMLGAGLKTRMRQDKKKQELRDRLMQAGFYGKSSAQWLVAVRIVAMTVPVVTGWLAAQLTSIPLTTGLFLGAATGLIGTLAPSFILDARKKKRQQRIRRSLPDAMDVLNVCLEGGTSLPASFAKAAHELVTAHPELALEFAIVDRETRMGRTVADSVRSFATRFDLEELRSMASVIAQAEKYGASVVTAMDIFAESMREKRTLQAETKAQQAVIQIIFPTLLCIFPALFVIVMGPAAIRIYENMVVNSGTR